MTGTARVDGTKSGVRVAATIRSILQLIVRQRRQCHIQDQSLVEFFFGRVLREDFGARNVSGFLVRPAGTLERTEQHMHCNPIATHPLPV